MTAQVYPSIDELIPSSMKAMLPVLLYEEISDRYARLGEAYLTEHRISDGRFVNGMMFTNRITNAIEEVVDAVFCVLGWIFKHGETDGNIPESAYTILEGLITIYGLLVAEKDDPLA